MSIHRPRDFASVQVEDGQPVSFAAVGLEDGAG